MYDDIAQTARRRTATVVAAVCAVVVVALVAVAGLVGMVRQPRRATPRPTPAPSPAIADPTARSSLPTVPATQPAVDDLSWVTVAGARLPASPTAGPRDTTGGRARGFARTRLGAVLAAAHISVRLSPQAGPAVFEATLREQVVGGDAAALGQHLAEDYERARAQLGLPYGAAAGQLYSTARGYRVEFDDADATVRLLIEGPGTAGTVLVVLALRLRWIAVDWALQAPPGGTWDTAATVVTDTGGYTRFSDGS